MDCTASGNTEIILFRFCWEVVLRPEGLGKAKYPPTIYGATLKGNYVMDTFHFHWGLRDYRGSEHRINGIRQVDNTNTLPKFHQCIIKIGVRGGAVG